MNDNKRFEEEIKRLKNQKNAVILAHNYQLPEVQDIADFTGDSLALSQEAAKTQADMIVFCGVHFMAETASIISPDKKVLIPDQKAGCSLADTINAEQLKAWKEENPGSVVVSYVNTTAEVKALSDYCCTSANAVQIVNSIPEDKEILFLPDMFLGAYAAKVTGRKIDIWPGECHVHAGIRKQDLVEMQDSHPEAEMIIHPECGCTTNLMYQAENGTSCKNGNGNGHENGHVKFLSTGGMIKHVKESRSKEFIIATETGMLHPLRKENPDKVFHPARENAVCKYMKMITLPKVLRSLEEEIFEVKVPLNTAVKAKKSIDRMLEVTS
ncbi:MAG: quinolinate synthase A [Thermodesulfobacteriota bacterium]|nr:MAG: quinolinate synthase A [Thermodesulfobacteriota bacterium]